MINRILPLALIFILGAAQAQTKSAKGPAELFRLIPEAQVTEKSMEVPFIRRNQVSIELVTQSSSISAPIAEFDSFTPDSLMLGVAIAATKTISPNSRVKSSGSLLMGTGASSVTASNRQALDLALVYQYAPNSWQGFVFNVGAGYKDATDTATTGGVEALRSEHTAYALLGMEHAFKLSEKWGLNVAANYKTSVYAKLNLNSESVSNAPLGYGYETSLSFSRKFDTVSLVVRPFARSWTQPLFGYEVNTNEFGVTMGYQF